MLEPIASPRPSVVALAASVLLLGPVLVGCQREEPSPEAAPPQTQAQTQAPVVSVAPAPTLDRASLLQAMDVAASAYAAGRDPGGADLVGRRFSVRQVFGCTGPATPPAADAASGDGLARWSWGDRRRTLKLTLAPGDWTDSALIAGGADSWEAAEGFWLTRPWLRTEGCPGVQGDPLAGGPVAPSPQTVGLAAVFDQDGYFRTGDMGRIDADGFLSITGRIKEMLIIGGENVFPREIEEVLNRHPSVKDSAVIGAPDPSRGEVALAFVELNDDATFDATALRAHCRESIAQFKVPRKIRLVSALPRNATGKIVRRQLTPDTPDESA